MDKNLKKIFRRTAKYLLLISPNFINEMFAKLPYSRFHMLHKYFSNFVYGEEIIEWLGVKFKVNPGKISDYYIYFFRPQNDIEINTLLEYSKGCSCFVDIGANAGTFSLIITNSNNNIITYAFEPNPAIQNIIKTNIQLNPNISDRVNYVMKAVSENSGSHEFALFKEDMHLARMVDDFKGEKEVVEVVSMDDYFKNLEIKPDIIKMDAEGEELKILKGMRNILKHNPPQTMLIEIHAGYYPEDEAKAFKQNIYDILTSNNYKLSALKENKLEVIEDPDTWPGRYHILALREN